MRRSRRRGPESPLQGLGSSPAPAGSQPAHDTTAREGRIGIATVLAGSLLFFSGLSALVFQVLWVKQLGLVVGVEVHAVALGVGAFFAGLALGGWRAGPLADRQARPLRLYAAVEAGIAVLAVLATLALARTAAPFVWLETHAGPLAWLLPMALVMLPALLMGATLPVLMRAVAPSEGRVGRAGGGLYAANTAGAIAGALLASFLLIPALGIRRAALAAAGLNLVVALVAWLMDRGGLAVAEDDAAAAAAPAAIEPMPASARAALWLYAAAGGVALGYEVVWSQALVQFMSTRAFAFSVLLATYLAGLMLGSALQARWADRIRDPWGVFGLLVAGAGLVALLEFALLGPWLLQWQSAAGSLLPGPDDRLASMSLRFAVAGLAVVFLPTVLLGAAFPVALRLVVDARQVGRGLGRVVALNTLGGIVGTLLAGFVLVPLLGLVRALGLLALVAAAVGLVAVWRAPGRARWAWPVVSAVALASVIAAVLTPPDRLAQLLTKARGGELVFYEESRGGTVAVVAQRSGSHAFKRLYIQGVSNSGDAMTSQRYMRLQALLPLIIARGEPRSALVIGLGTGITAGALLAYPTLQDRVVAELLPAVARATTQFSGNQSVASDPRVQIRLRDGRRELLGSTQAYDLITLEPPPPSAVGVVNLYSSDFYRLAASRLAKGGLFAQWLPLPTQNEEDSRALVKSFLDAFPHATLWSTELHEMLLVGSFDPIELDVPRITQRFNQPTVAASLGEVGVASPAALLATWVMGREGLEQFAGDALPVTDDRPRIEYADWVRPGEFTRVLPTLYQLADMPVLRGEDAQFKAELAAEQRRLRGFYRAGLSAYRRDEAAWAQDMRQLMREDGGNPYYRWFVGGAAAQAEGQGNSTAGTQR
ncbi:spermidine synthase [Variovorax sp. OV329]|nr:spermidine synthase [Variovorax sp. OV329]